VCPPQLDNTRLSDSAVSVFKCNKLSIRARPESRGQNRHGLTQGGSRVDLISRLASDEDGDLHVLWDDGERVFCRQRRWDDGAGSKTVLAVLPAGDPPAAVVLDRLAHEYELKDDLDGPWVVRPLGLVRERGRTMLLLEDTQSGPLDRLLAGPMDVARFLPLAIAIVAALTQVHRRGLVHKDIKPANILVNGADGHVQLTGFGIASRLPRERQAPAPPETLAGTLAYMAPEQTGRMNRSIDARTDLYALGVTLYQMLAGHLPFTASDPMEWVHCHIARRPVPLGERLGHVPLAVSNIIMKLLAKTAEERYQTAAGVEHDLRRCLADWDTRGRIEAFPLSQNDMPDWFLIAEKLYGRAHEVKALLAAFDRVVRSSAPELVLVAGYSGIGKSSVVNELHQALVPPRGLFASGKFDQYKRDVPYVTLVQAFQSLVRPLLGRNEAELAHWREAFLDALGPNARLMVDLIPELKLVIGEQPPVAKLPPQDAQRRFQLVFRRFLGVFARPEHPLALFLDDLQWLDAATLDLLADLLTQTDVRHLLLIGAYRDNEVDAAHPLMRKLDAIKDNGGKIQEIKLAPLTEECVGQLVADALRCDSRHAAPLTRLVHDKTAGNPFFVIQFLHALAEEHLLAFDHVASRWTWDLDRIRAKSYTENVVDFMVGKIARLPAQTQTALQQLACLGSAAETPLLALILRTLEASVDAMLSEALRQELVERVGSCYRFSHDRVQEAAYSLIPTASRAASHLAIGKLLASTTPAERRDEVIFDIANQLNRGASAMGSMGEREQAAKYNLLAGRRARNSTAYKSALNYLTAGSALLPPDPWGRYYQLAFDLELLRAECEFLTGALAAAEQRLTALSGHEETLADRTAIICLRLDLYTTLGRSDRAVQVSLEYLRQIGIYWNAHPTREEVQQEYARVWEQLGDRPIEELARLPAMADPLCLSTLEVLASLQAPARFTDEQLPRLVAGRMTNISLENGNSDASPLGYVWFGQLLTCLSDYQNGLRFGKLGVNLVEKAGLGRFKSRAFLAFGHSIGPWNDHVNISVGDLRLAFEEAQKVGDVTFASYASHSIATLLLFAGDPLSSVDHYCEDAAAFIQKAGFGLVAGMIGPSRQLIKTLRGRTDRFGSLTSSPAFVEIETERYLDMSPQPKIATCWYWVRKLQARFFAHEWAAAVEAASEARQLLWTSQSNVEEAEYLFYGALALAAHYEAASTVKKAQYKVDILELLARLRALADNCPENFADRAALVAAEVARIEVRVLEAMDLYEQAIQAAARSGFVHTEALAYETAAHFYRTRGFSEIALCYLRSALNGYVRWGADGKVRQLVRLYPELGEKQPTPGLTNTIGAPVEQLDLATVIKLSQAVSGAIERERLLTTVMRAATEHEGAERGVLVLSRGGEPRIAAEATIEDDAIVVHLRDEAVTPAALPESILRYVLHTREGIILDDAMARTIFSADPYIRGRRARSVLGLPLITQASFIGVLYLENNLAAGAFAPARIAVLKLLASQAAIALENAQLYRDLAERDAKIKSLVDANIIGIFILGADDQIIDANEAFLKLVGYNRDDLLSGRLRWTDLTPPEWRDRHARAAIELQATGTVQPYEREYFRQDGSRVPALIGSARIEGSANQGVVFVLDLTERNRAAKALHDVKTELAHANRLATMGQLTASIAHEVAQPITAVTTNAQVGLRLLAARPPDLEEAREALACIIGDVNRASDVLGRIRDLVKKSPPRADGVDINEAIRAVIELTRSESVENDASVRTELADELPLVHGDRVQLQQVVLNLIVNALQAIGADAHAARDALVTTAQAGADGVVVAVKDWGPGVAADSSDRIFDPFYSTKPGGFGMGLSICRSIIEAHGGRLWVSPNQPCGAVFQFIVPAHHGS
jgi:PAS domain S-box-containing protein